MKLNQNQSEKKPAMKQVMRVLMTSFLGADLPPCVVFQKKAEEFSGARNHYL